MTLIEQRLRELYPRKYKNYDFDEENMRWVMKPLTPKEEEEVREKYSPPVKIDFTIHHIAPKRSDYTSISNTEPIVVLKSYKPIEVDLRDTEDEEIFYTTSEFAILIGIPISRLRSWDKTGKLKPHHVLENGYKRYSSKQKEISLSKKRRRKQRKAVSAELRETVLHRDNYTCTCCGSTDGLQVHHIVYRSKGGGNDLENLTTLCEMCHLEKHDGEPVSKIMRKRLGLPIL